MLALCHLTMFAFILCMYAFPSALFLDPVPPCVPLRIIVGKPEIGFSGLASSRYIGGRIRYSGNRYVVRHVVCDIQKLSCLTV